MKRLQAFTLTSLRQPVLRDWAERFLEIQRRSFIYTNSMAREKNLMLSKWRLMYDVYVRIILTRMVEKDALIIGYGSSAAASEEENL